MNRAVANVSPDPIVDQLEFVARYLCKSILCAAAMKIKCCSRPPVPAAPAPAASATTVRFPRRSTALLVRGRPLPRLMRRQDTLISVSFFPMSMS